MRRWDLKAKPSKPSMSFRHSAAVTGLNHPNDRHLVSCSMDGRLFLWDIRRPVQPLCSMASPDGRYMSHVVPHTPKPGPVIAQDMPLHDVAGKETVLYFIWLWLSDCVCCAAAA